MKKNGKDESLLVINDKKHQPTDDDGYSESGVHRTTMIT